jgi:hypothetical protein
MHQEEAAEVEVQVLLVEIGAPQMEGMGALG